MATVNIWAIIVASIVAFGIGALWYSPILFGKEWMSLMGMTDKDIAGAKASSMWGSYVIHFIFTLISFIVVAFAIATTGSIGASNGAFVGFLAWLGFVVPINASNLLWERKPFKLILINTICILVTLVIGSAIIGGWR